MPSAASGASSRKALPGSSRPSTRSRGSSLPRLTWRSLARSGPPNAAVASFEDESIAICEELGRIADVKYESDKALICLVGEDIRGQSGIAAQVFAAVSHVNIRMISQGASEINMSFMINEEDVEEAVRSLHKKFFVAPDPTIFDVEARPVTSNA